MLPSSLIQSLQFVKGFEQHAFETVHANDQLITSVRLNSVKQPIFTNASSFVCQSTDTVAWCKYGRYLAERPSFTLDPLFHAGAYYVQEASSMFLWQILKQVLPNTSNKKILDLCAAPGGKSTLIAAYAPDALLVSNEVIKTRAAILEENIIKWGNKNSVITNNDPAHFKSLPDFFDMIVLDAPCSGSGLFRRDKNAINEWSEDAVELCAQRQKRIIADVWDSLKEDGYLIYSTCSYSIKENELIADWIKQTFNTASINIKMESNWQIVETISDAASYGYRFWPHLLRGEGFFVTVFQKKTTTDAGNFRTKFSLEKTNKSAASIISEKVQIGDDCFLFNQSNQVACFPTAHEADLNLLKESLYIKSAGIKLGEIKHTDFIPDHHLAMANTVKLDYPRLEVQLETALEYLRKKDIAVTGTKGWNLICYCGLHLGWIKVLPNRINNYYPMNYRILKS